MRCLRKREKKESNPGNCGKGTSTMQVRTIYPGLFLVAAAFVCAARAQDPGSTSTGNAKQEAPSAQSNAISEKRSQRRSAPMTNSVPSAVVFPWLETETKQLHSLPRGGQSLRPEGMISGESRLRLTETRFNSCNLRSTWPTSALHN